MEMGSIVPPRVKDAGLGNYPLCFQAFSEDLAGAAEAARSEGSSISDGGPSIQPSPQWPHSPLHHPHTPRAFQGSQGSRVGGFIEESAGEVIIVGDEGLHDKLMDADLAEEGASCVAALEGLPSPRAIQGAEEDDEEGFPILAEAD